MKKIVFDSNILIDLFNKNIEMLEFAQRFAPYKWYVSEITEMEVLAKPELSAQEEAEIRVFLRRCKIIRLTKKIKAEAIRVRRIIRRKLPDSIVAATAVVLGISLISNDPHLLKAKYQGLRVKGF